MMVYMEQEQAGFAGSVVAIVVAVLVLGGLSFFVLSRSNNQATPPQGQTPGVQNNTQTQIKPNNAFGKLPAFKAADFKIGAGGAGIIVKPTSFELKRNLPSFPNVAEVYSFNTQFSSAYVAGIANAFGMTLLSQPNCSNPNLDCPMIENGVRRIDISGAGKSWVITRRDEPFHMLRMLPNGELTFDFAPQASSPLFTLPQTKSKDEAIQKARAWLSLYPSVFGDVTTWKAEVEPPILNANPLLPMKAVVFQLPSPDVIYRAPRIRVAVGTTDTNIGFQVGAVIDWLSTKNLQVGLYEVRPVEEKWLAVQNNRGAYVLGISEGEAAKFTDSKGIIGGTFVVDEVSMAHGRADDLSSKEFYLQPVYVFSGFLDTGKGKIPLKVWIPAVLAEVG